MADHGGGGGGMMGAYPQVFVVDTQAPCGPVPVPMPVPVYPRRGGWRQRVLGALVGLALLGVLIEACCIYNLHRDHGETGSTAKITSNEIPETPQRKPAALLKGFQGSEKKPQTTEKNNVLLWTGDGDGFLHEIIYKDGLLTVRQEGYYFLYSKVALSESHCELAKHTVMKNSQRYGNGKRAIELMQSVRYHCPKTQKGEKQDPPANPDVANSYLGGAFHLFANDSVYVRFDGQMRPGLKENFFGAFML
ncbi:tumor necrosis factor ligand superfamily member 14-like [Sardina pilchardus]|uniref:tumor necrosis factor ligand superfamily member 14-like n=1 Tax=Sardina pilchardus TaxID=27697 RepID=UPI002E133378